MKTNEMIFLDDYNEIDIEDIIIVNEPVDMVDIEVEDDNTFCIGEKNIISHNCIKSMMRVLTYKAAKAKVPILFSNHIYEGMEMFPSLVKTQSGGKGPIYLASVLVQLSTRNEKTSDNDGVVALANSHNISGVTLGALTIKNRFVPSFLKTELYLNFKTGLDPYAGLFELAEAFEVIKKAEKGYSYLFNGESIGRKKEFEKSKEVWDKVMPTLENVLNEKLCYGGGGDSDDIADEIEELESEE